MYTYADGENFLKYQSVVFPMEDLELSFGSVVSWEKIENFLKILIEVGFDMDKLSSVYILMYISRYPQIVDFFINNGINITEKSFKHEESQAFKNVVDACLKITSNPHIITKIIMSRILYDVN